MPTEDMVPANEFCIHHNIELSFIYSLNQSGLIEIITVEEKIFVPVSQLNQLEKLVRLYYDMDINLEGIETITYLLQRMNDMQQQITYLTNRLSMFKNGEV
jgi:chaperone modulatory protein CbpM